MIKIQTKTTWAGLIGIICSISSTVSFASIPIANVSNIGITVYGMYITNDATCKTGWTALKTFDKNAVSQNFKSSPQIGQGTVSSSTKCVLLIVKNSCLLTVAAGTYTGTTNGNSDSVCNAGAQDSKAVFYGQSSFQTSAGVTWPATTELPSKDMAAAGITQITTLSSPTGNEIVPIYVSANSACAGNATVDAANASCVTADAGNNTGTVPPQSAGDTTHGYNLATLPASATSYSFIIDMTNSIGGAGSGVCSVGAAPPMYFTGS